MKDKTFDAALKILCIAILATGAVTFAGLATAMLMIIAGSTQ